MEYFSTFPRPPCLPTLLLRVSHNHEATMKVAMGWTAHLPAEERQRAGTVSVELDLYRVAGGHIQRPNPHDRNCETMQNVSAANANDHVITLVDRDLISPGWRSPPIVEADNGVLSPNAPVSSGGEGENFCPSRIPVWNNNVPPGPKRDRQTDEHQNHR